MRSPSYCHHWKYASCCMTALEHLQGFGFNHKKGRREPRDVPVEVGLFAGVYCGAESADRTLCIATEKVALLLQRSIRRPHGNQVPHNFEESSDVVFGLTHLRRPGESQRREFLPEPHEDFLPSGLGQVKRGVGSHLCLPRPDKQLVVLELRRLRVHCARGGGQPVPGLAHGGRRRVARALLCGADGGEQSRVGPRIEKARKQGIVAGARLILRHLRRLEMQRADCRAHFFTSEIEISCLFSIMSTTRQSAHICSLLSAPSPENIECPVSLPSMLSTILRVPKGFPQRTQLNGSAWLSTTSCLACAESRSRGTSVIAFSGQVFSHNPHCTQLRSMNFSIGSSRPSTSADSGHAPTHARHSVHVSLLTSTCP